MESELQNNVRVISPPNRNEPKVYHRDDGISITSKFVRIFGTTYALSHLVSVRPSRIKPSYLQNILVWSIICGGVVGIPIAIVLVMLTRTDVTALVALVGIVVGVVIGILVSKPKYVVRISVSSGEVEQIFMHDERATRHLSSVIVQAMVERE